MPSCAVTLRFDCQVEGVGVDPRTRRWVGGVGRRGAGSAARSTDGTGGLNKPGRRRAARAAGHRRTPHRGRRAAGCAAGWSRPTAARLHRQPAVTGRGVHHRRHHRRRPRRDRVPTRSSAVRGLARPAVPAAQPPGGARPSGDVLEVSGRTAGSRGPRSTTSPGAARRPALPRSTPRRRDRFGPAVREPGRQLRPLRRRAPAKGRRSGSGVPHRRRRRGNVGAGRSACSSRRPVRGPGHQPGPASAAWTPRPSRTPRLRGPLAAAPPAGGHRRGLREPGPGGGARGRAVRCVPRARTREGVGGVRVLVVPSVAGDGERNSLEFHQLMLSDDVYERGGPLPRRAPHHRRGCSSSRPTTWASRW